MKDGGADLGLGTFELRNGEWPHVPRYTNALGELVRIRHVPKCQRRHDLLEHAMLARA